jgi:hypothetical protein
MSNNQTLCDFAVTEMIHDFGKKRDGMDPGPEAINLITATRYKANRQIFDKLLDLGVPGCNKKFNKYDEEGILKYVAGATIQKDILNGSINDTEIETVNGNTYHVKIANKNSPDNIENGEAFFDELEFGHYNKNPNSNLGRYSGLSETCPVILADTVSWVYNMFKKGSSSDRRIYAFSPLAVIADSASKANITIKSEMKHYFDNSDGVEIVNVVDRETFKVKSFKNNSKGFFSNYSIINTYNQREKGVDQLWMGLEFQGRDKSGKPLPIKRTNVHEANNVKNVFSDITTLINSKTPQTLKRNAAALSNLLNEKDRAKERERFNIAIQSKRSGDWFPVIYILNYDEHEPELITYNDPKQERPFPIDEKIYFTKNNMYILTIDRPLVAYSLYSGVNVLYQDANGNLIKFEASPLNDDI